MNDDRKWSRAGLRLFSTMLAPDEIGEVLGLQAARSFRLGDPISSRSRGVRPQHGFFVKSGVSADEPLEEHLIALLALIEGVGDRLQSLRSQVDADIFCGFSSGNGQGGFTLSPPTLRRLADLELDLILDLYPPPGEDA